MLESHIYPTHWSDGRIDWTGILINQTRGLTEADAIAYSRVSDRKARFILGTKHGYCSFLGHLCFFEEIVEAYKRISQGRG